MLNEAVLQRIYERLLERFGEPISDDPPTVGIKDERCLTDDDYAEQPEHHPWGAVDEDDELDEDDLDEVTPPGYEKIVKGLKRSKSVKNPWAVAWSMKNKGIKPKR